MGRRKHSPKHGSMSYSPRKRAKSIVGRIVYWPELQKGPQLEGFAGYKAGMTHIFMIENRDRAPDFGKEVFSPVTVLDTPPMLICGARAYSSENGELRPLTEAWMKDLPRDLSRVVRHLPEGGPEENLDRIQSSLDKIVELRLLSSTQPSEAGVSKKKPELMEIKVGGGSKEQQLEFVKRYVGKTVSISDVFKLGELIDIVGITKGKGIQGSIKRWHVKIRPRKSRKHTRNVATLGPWHPARVLRQIPRPGQMGFHQRTEYNKRILRIASDGTLITPPGGFNRYGVVHGDYVILEGSVMGSQKRLIKLRKAARRTEVVETLGNITYVHSAALTGERNV